LIAIDVVLTERVSDVHSVVAGVHVSLIGLDEARIREIGEEVSSQVCSMSECGMMTDDSGA
jgi:hypothetical protein